MNILSSATSILTQKIMEMRVADSLKGSIPVEPKFEEPKPEKDSTGNSTTKDRKRVSNKISDSAKEGFEKNKVEAQKQYEESKKAVTDKVNNAVAENMEELTKLSTDITELGISLGELMTTCVAFPIRFALAAPSIIGTCPVGPTVQPTQLVMTLKQFKEVGDDMGTKYSKAQAAWNKLNLDNLIESAKSNPVIAMIPGFAATLSPLSAIFSTVTTVFTTTKPMITLVGGSISEIKPPSVPTPVSLSISSPITPRIQTYAGDEWPGPFGISEEEVVGQEVQMEAPDVDYEADPEACFNFSQRAGTFGITAQNCNNFKAIQPDKGVSCDNCIKYAPFHKQLTIRLRENTRDIYGSNDLWLKSDSFTPLPGSLKYRMTAVEGKVADNVGWSVAAGWDKDNKYIWIDLKNSKSQVLNPEPTTSHSTTFNIDFQTKVKDVKRVNIWRYDDIKSEDVKLAIDSLMGWRRVPIDTRNLNSIWGLEADLEDDSLDTVILYKEEEIPETDRILGNTYVVYTFENSSGEELKPLWINVSLLSVKYDFLTSMDTVTKDYLNLEWGKVQENHAMVVTADLKYNPTVAASVSGVSEMASGINDVMKGISSANGQGKINNNEE